MLFVLPDYTTRRACRAGRTRRGAEIAASRDVVLEDGKNSYDVASCSDEFITC
jgi:hypothetical protein